MGAGLAAGVGVFLAAGAVDVGLLLRCLVFLAGALAVAGAALVAAGALAGAVCVGALAVAGALAGAVCVGALAVVGAALAAGAVCVGALLVVAVGEVAFALLVPAAGEVCAKRPIAKNASPKVNATFFMLLKMRSLCNNFCALL